MNSSGILEQLFDIYGIVHVPWWQRPVIKYISCLLLGLLVLIFCWYVVKKIVLKKKPLSPWRQALESLEALKNSTMLNEREAKFFYTQLTSIIKQYIYSRFGYDIYGKTDHEVLAYLDEQIAFPRELLPVLADILDHASAIKFANVQGLIAQMERDLASSISIVKETVPEVK